MISVLLETGGGDQLTDDDRKTFPVGAAYRDMHTTSHVCAERINFIVPLRVHWMQKGNEFLQCLNVNGVSVCLVKQCVLRSVRDCAPTSTPPVTNENIPQHTYGICTVSKSTYSAVC